MNRPVHFHWVVVAVMVALLLLQGSLPQSEAKKSSKSKGKAKGGPIKPPVIRGAPGASNVLQGFRDAEETYLIDDVTDADLNYVGMVNKCADFLNLCPHSTLGPHLCSLACLFDRFPHIRHTIYLMNDVTMQMCAVTETVFDGMMRDFDSDVRTLEQFLNLHQFSAQEGYSKSTHIEAASNAVSFQIIKLSNLTSLDGLKMFISSIYASNTAAKVANIGFRDRDVINDVCPNVDYADSTQKLAEELISRPALADIILDGYFALSHIAPLGSFGPVSPVFEAMMIVMKALTGVDCGLLDFMATGTTIDCSSIVGKKRVNTKPSGDVKPKDGDPICGAKMDIPPVELGEKFPSLFPFKVLEPAYVSDYVAPGGGNPLPSLSYDVDLADDNADDNTSGNSVEED